MLPSSLALSSLALNRLDLPGLEDDTVVLSPSESGSATLPPCDLSFTANRRLGWVLVGMDVPLGFGAETFFVASAVGSEDGFEEYESRLASSLTVRSSFGDSQPSGRASSDSGMAA